MMLTWEGGFRLSMGENHGTIFSVKSGLSAGAEVLL